MRIGLILSNTPGYSETFFKYKIKGLLAQGMDVRLYCQHKSEDFKICPVIESPKISRNPLLQFWYFLKEIALLLPYTSRVFHYIELERKEGTGLIQIFKRIYLNSHLLKAKADWLHFGFATLALGSETVAQAIGAKMAVSIRGFDIAIYPLKHPGCYQTLWKYVDKVHTISDDLIDLAYKQGLPTNVSVQKITPAIDVNQFKSEPQEFSNNGKIIFVTTGRLHWKKGYVQTIEALAILKNQGFKFIYKIIGEGPEYERIAFAAYQLGLKENVQFLGKLPHADVKKELETATIYIQYSIQEGFCNAVLEAQAMGKLCVVSNAEGLGENVLHEETGWVVAKLSPMLLAQQLIKVIELDKDEKIAISKNASKRVRTYFNIENQQKRFVAFYKFLN